TVAPSGNAASAAAPALCPPTPQQPSSAQLQAAQREARDRGFLWRITKQGRSSYLFGTLHVGKLPWIFAGPRLQQALAGTDTLALEIDIPDPSLLRSPPSSATAPLALPEEMRARLARQVEAACLPEHALDHLNPLMQAVTLTVLS